MPAALDVTDAGYDEINTDNDRKPLLGEEGEGEEEEESPDKIQRLQEDLRQVGIQNPIPFFTSCGHVDDDGVSGARYHGGQH